MADQKSSQRLERKHKGASPRERSILGLPLRIVVKFFDDTPLPYDEQAAVELDRLSAGTWQQLAERFPGITLHPMFTSVSPDRIRQLVAEAMRRDHSYRPPNFETYFVVEIPSEITVESLLCAILALRSVQTAYVDPPHGDPAVDPSDDPRFPDQGHLHPAPQGIAAEWAWRMGIAGGDGAGQSIIDLEQGWTLDHEDLIGQGAKSLFGTLLDESRPHGTAVLGVICEVDNKIGGIGIAPNVGSVNVVSTYGTTVANAIFAALDQLPYGGILLLETQVEQLAVGGTTLTNLPIEVLDAEFAAIRLATALGIIVVEAAGNGSNDLDTFGVAGGKLVLNRSDPAFRDSGAIMVGAATSDIPHTCMIFGNGTRFGNYGSRIDCYAWGEGVNTCDSTPTPPFSTNGYTSGFDGTSSASAIIAGAALVVQGIAEANLKFRFSALQMRALLSNPATGTASSNPASDRIGVMPDLQAIISSEAIGLSADVYIRDFVGDKGDPNAAAVSTSPDIILRPVAESNPQAAFGVGSGTENNDSLSSAAFEGQDNFIYVRVSNRGGSDSVAVTADVFWSQVASLITPDLWTHIGSVVIPKVPSGNVLTVSDAITWAAADIPGAGHYCFVALIGSVTDPAPRPPDLLDWNNFENLIRNNNNVAWRNFNVVDSTPGLTAGPRNYVPLSFLAPGPPDAARRMRLEVHAKLPQGSRALLEMPLAMYDGLCDGIQAEIDRDRQTAVVPINPHGLRSFGDFLFPAKSRSKLRLLIQIPKKNCDIAYEVFARQMYNELEVGRVTWRLGPVVKRPISSISARHLAP